MPKAHGQQVVDTVSDRTATTTTSESNSEVFQGDLRLVWGGPVQRPIQASLELDEGRITFVRNLSQARGSSNSVYESAPNRLTISPRDPAAFGGFDFRLDCPLTATLEITFAATASQAAIVRSYPIVHLVRGRISEHIDDVGTRLSVERQAYDRLRIQEQSTRLDIVDCNQSISVQASAYRTSLTAGTYELVAHLNESSGRTIETVREQVSIDAAGNCEPVELTLPTPRSEGVFHWDFALVSKRRLPAFQSDKPLLRRRLEFVALDQQNRGNSIAGWQEVANVNAADLLDGGILDWINLGNASAYAWDNLTGRSPIERLGFGGSKPILIGDVTAVDLPVGGLRTTPEASHAVTPASHRPKSKLSCLELGTDSWIGIPLESLDNNRPHRLRVTLPAGLGDDLLVSLRSDLPAKSERGQTVRQDSIGNDYRIVTSHITDGYTRFQEPDNASSAFPEGRVKQIELLFWPAEDPNYLVFANTSQTNSAYVAQFRLDVAKLQPKLPTTTEESAAHVGIQIDKPLLASCFSSGRIQDPASGSWLDSWETFYSSVSRLIQSLEFANANLLFLKVAADGGTLYPSERLSPNLLFDNGAYFSDSRTPAIKDSVELLMRLCNRRDIKVVLAIDLDSPTIQLAQYARENDEAGLFQRHQNGGTSDRWNPLHPQVQQSVRDTVSELIARYASHECFGGIQLQIDRNAHLTFRGDLWGFQPEDIAQFQKLQTGSPQEVERTRFAANPQMQLNRKAKSLYFAWRAQQLARFYQELASEVRRAAPNANLLLNIGRLWDEQLTESDFEQPGTHARSPDRFLQAIGIDLALLSQIEGVDVVGGAFVPSEETIDAEQFVYWAARKSKLAVLPTPVPLASDLRATTSVDSDRRTGSRPRPSITKLVHQQPDAVVLRADDASGGEEIRLFPININGTTPTKGYFQSEPLSLTSSFSPVGQITKSVSGAWLPNGHDLLALRNAFGEMRNTAALRLRWKPLSLTASEAPEVDSPLRHQAYSIKIAVDDHSTFVRVSNFAPWRQTIVLESNERFRDIEYAPFTPSDGGPLRKDLSPDSSLIRWQIPVDGHSSRVIRFESPSMAFVAANANSPEPVLQAVRTELRRLGILLANEQDPTLRTVHANVHGDFEQWEEISDSATSQSSRGLKPSHWNTSQLPGVRFHASPDFPRSGETSLKITNTNSGDASAWIQSKPIPAPATGRLSLEAWMRVPTSNPSARVRLSVQGTTSGGKRFAASNNFGSIADRTRQLPTDWGPRPVSLHVADIPTEELESLVVSIELIGEGTVWIDDVRVLQSWLHPSESSFLHGKFLSAEEDLSNGNYLSALNLLNSPWVRYLKRRHPLFEVPPISARSPDQFVERSHLNENTGHDPSRFSGGSVWGRPAEPSQKSSLIEQFKETVTEGWQR
ncbi:MAG: family 10 glycosylhydrolase [Aureliella sp.]